jgi:hypothetical protein
LRSAHQHFARSILRHEFEDHVIEFATPAPDLTETATAI